MNEEEDYPKCEECGERRATVHLTDVVEGQAVPHHYCAQCWAEKEGEAAGGGAAAELFARLLEALGPELEELDVRNCPACGTSYLEFRQNMELGCPNDYEVFDKPLQQVLERIHGSSQHCGKVPPGVDRETTRRTRMRGLKQRLEEAVAEEDYEQAAELRDRIQGLEENEAGESEG
ncbi:MAG: UvrB/UvrC motif-containing protein [Planctomycetota bacterium]